MRDRVALQERAGRAVEVDPGHGSMLPIGRVGSAPHRRSRRVQFGAQTQHRTHTAEWYVTRAASEGVCSLASRRSVHKEVRS